MNKLLFGLLVTGCLFIFLGCPHGYCDEPAKKPNPSRSSNGQPSALPLPSSLPIGKFQEVLHEFLRDGKYKQLGWQVDKGVRDTGPYIRGWNYGTHHTVRIFYSPEVMQWLLSGRSEAIPDGAMIVKEQYGQSPAASHDDKSEDELWESLKAWTIMIKDSQGSYDGWFWANPAKAAGDHESLDNHKYPYNHKDAGFGIYCMRCHAVTESPAVNKEYTFSSLRNIKGFHGHPVLFRVDQSWRAKPKKKAIKLVSKKENPNEVDPDGAHTRCLNPIDPSVCPTRRSEDFLSHFKSIPEQTEDAVLHIPPVTHDRVVRAPADKVSTQAFVTSNQCMSCHAGLVGEFGPIMFAHTEDTSQYKNGTSKYGGEGIDYSPYGEWRWSPMGLAGRDPIFYAQMETELAILDKEFADDPEKKEMISANLVSTCLRCHGAMGKHQFDLDHQASGDPHAKFELANIYEHNSVFEKQTKADQYGALARDGISCTVCHRMQPREQPADDDRPYLQFFLETSITGNFHLGPPGELYGPYKDKDISVYPMEHGIGFKPKHSEYIKSSRMCGTCHTVNLPVVDFPNHEGDEGNELSRAEAIPEFRDFHHHVEQATYLEWLNSAYENEFNTSNPSAQTCQDCHMSRNLKSLAHPNASIDKIQTQVAIIQDTSYPDAENLAPHDKIQVRQRNEYSRHNFSGLNMFLVEMFNQFDDVLGVRKVDYMTGTEQLPHAKDNFLLTAREKTAEVNVETEATGLNQIEAKVLVRSKVGHRFPSGVGFRRAFLEVVAVDSKGKVVWGSGRTNGLGMLVDGDGQVLKTEFLQPDESGEQQFQPHHQEITSQDQAQIYETLLCNQGGTFTTSFIHGCVIVKDNRLLPLGWTRKGPDPRSLNGKFLEATFPQGKAEADPRYGDGSGSDETVYRITLPTGIKTSDVKVRATLYYQSIPPYFLRTIFETTPDSPAAKRLHYICSNLDLNDTPMQDWKLKIVSDEKPVSE